MVFLHSLQEQPLTQSDHFILITVSEVKNTNSGWVNGSFQWGSGPTLLKTVGVEVKIDADKNYKVFALNKLGQRTAEIPVVKTGTSYSFDTSGFNTPWFEIVCEPSSINEGILVIENSGSFNTTGIPGGTFTPSSKTYTLKNDGNASLTWQALVSESWLTVSLSNGTLKSGETNSVIVSINSSAVPLDTGTYTGTVTFQNTSNGIGSEAINVILTINSKSSKLSTPSNVLAGNGLSTEYVKISWSAVTGAAYYNVYRAETANGTKELIASTNDTVYRDKSASSGKVYYYFITACGNGTESEYSLYDTGFKRPLAPFWVNATDGLLKSYVKITWQVVEGAQYYKIYRANAPGGKKKYIGKSYTTTFRDKKARRGRVYYYFVRSVFNGVKSAYSAYESGYKYYTTDTLLSNQKTFKTSKLSMAFLSASYINCLLYTSPSPRDLSTSRMPSSA